LKKILLIIIFLFLCYGKTIRAVNYEFIWNDTVIDIPVKDSINNYRDKPYCQVYLNGKLQEYPLYYERGVNFTTLTTVQTNRLGIYRVHYRVSFRDESNTRYANTKTIEFHVKDFEAPVVISNEPIKIPIDNINLIDAEFLKRGLRITDNYSRLENIKIETDLKAVNLKIGSQQIPFTAIDEAGNITYFERTLIIFDDRSPNLTIINEHLKLSVGGYYDLSKNVIASDNSEELPTIAIFPEIDFNKVGIYEVTYQATDASGNLTTKIGIVEIVDDILPVLRLKTTEVKFTRTEYSTLNFVSYILEASDNYDLLSDKDVFIDSNEYDIIDLKESFNITYSLSDLSGNTSIVTLKFSLTSNIEPQIVFKDINIEIGFNFDPKKDVTAVCSLGRDLTERILISYNSVNINKVGTYRISYYVYDDFGNTLTKNRTVTVVNNKTNENQFNKIINLLQEHLLIIIGVLIVVAGAIYYKYKKKV